MSQIVRCSEDNMEEQLQRTSPLNKVLLGLLTIKWAFLRSGVVMEKQQGYSGAFLGISILMLEKEACSLHLSC
jgi:hypothetical protein